GFLLPTCQAQVRFFALHRIEPHAPPLVRAPVNSFEFQPCGRTPQADDFMRELRHGGRSPPTPGRHRLRLGLPGYLIPFAPPAFAPQRRSSARALPSPSVYPLISTHSTATPGIPRSSPTPQPDSLRWPSGVEPRAFTADLAGRLRALYAQ